MCCGNGDDLDNWKNGHISHLINVDISDQAVAVCRERYIQMLEKETKHHQERLRESATLQQDVFQESTGPLFSAEFHVVDCSSVRLLDHLRESRQTESPTQFPGSTNTANESGNGVINKKAEPLSSSESCSEAPCVLTQKEVVPAIGVSALRSRSSSLADADIATCHLALHYLFGSAERADMAVRNLAELVRPGGYVLCTIMDANKIMCAELCCNFMSCYAFLSERTGLYNSVY